MAEEKKIRKKRAAKKPDEDNPLLEEKKDLARIKKEMDDLMAENEAQIKSEVTELKKENEQLKNAVKREVIQKDALEKEFDKLLVKNTETKKEVSTVKQDRDSWKDKFNEVKNETVTQIKSVTKWPVKTMIFGGLLLIGITVLLTTLFNNYGAKKYDETEITRLESRYDSIGKKLKIAEEKSRIDSLEMVRLDEAVDREKEITKQMFGNHEALRSDINKNLNEKIRSNKNADADALRRSAITDYGY